jgi:DNA polymerase-3 subunit delta'
MSTRWDGIVGHDWAVQLLSGAITYDRIGHAYLITGPEHIGKTTLSRAFAQVLNCTSGDHHDSPCGHCRSCSLIASDRHPDVRLIEPELSPRGKKSLKIEQVRQLRQDLNLAAYEARYKVAILTDFEAATIGAANAFLKMLEEPPSRVILMLTARDADTLLPTISSRCHTIGLRPLPTSLIEKELKARGHVAAEEAHLLAHLSDGRLGWALQATQNPAMLADRSDHLEQLYDAIAGNRVARFRLAESLAGRPDGVPATLRSWLSWWRDANYLSQLAQVEINSGNRITNIDQRAYLERMARSWGRERIFSCLKRTSLALWQLERNANTRLVLENLFLEYPSAPA